MVSMGADNGKIMWERYVAEAGFPILGPSQYDNEHISIIGNRLITINPDTGEEVKNIRLDFGVTCPAARNSSHSYIADTANRLRVFRAKDNVKLFEVSAENESKINSIVADEKSVIFGTDAGNVICIKADEPKRLWQFNAYGAVIEPMVRDANSLFFASKDTNLWKVNIDNGSLIGSIRQARYWTGRRGLRRMLFINMFMTKGLRR